MSKKTPFITFSAQFAKRLLKRASTSLIVFTLFYRVDKNLTLSSGTSSYEPYKGVHLQMLNSAMLIVLRQILLCKTSTQH